MKIKLLSTLYLLFLSLNLLAQIPTPGNEDDFQVLAEGTMNWNEPGLSPNPPVRIANGGPLGAGDAYMEDVATGVGSAGSRVIVRNSTQWTGDISGFVAVQFDARASNNDLEFRVAINGAGGPICSSNSVIVTQGSGWNTVTIPISSADMQTVASNCCGTGTDVDLTLGDVFEFRIISADLPAYRGDKINAVMDLDNIAALTTLSTNEYNRSDDFQISPNPGNSIVTLQVPKLEDDYRVEVFDVLGKRILNRSISSLETRLNVAPWKDGVYLVRVSGEFGSQTKRFIKQ